MTLDGETTYYDIVTVTPFRPDILDSTNLDPGLPTELAFTHYKEVAKQLPPTPKSSPCPLKHMVLLETEFVP